MKFYTAEMTSQDGLSYKDIEHMLQLDSNLTYALLWGSDYASSYEYHTADEIKELIQISQDMELWNWVKIDLDPSVVYENCQADAVVIYRAGHLEEWD